MNWKRLAERITNWELWPFELRYLFITPVWAWYCLRSGSFWFFTASNPTITFGGFEGEGKKEMYEQLPMGTYPRTTYILPTEPFDAVLEKLKQGGFSYPFVVKPDVGMKGLLFRKIDSEKELQVYHQKNPVEYIVQDLVTYPLEVSVFYYRHPNRARGVISGFIQKDLMDVTGDGVSTLQQLLENHPNAKYRLEEMQIKHRDSLARVLPAGERFILTYAANLNRGARFINLAQHIDDDLLRLFDDLSHRTSFYYGRYDIKCASIEALKQGRNFSILEFNGSGAEPNHVYQQGYSLFAAQKVFLHHWKMLYQISAMNHRQGHKYWTFGRGWRFLKEGKKHLAILEKYDREIPV